MSLCDPWQVSKHPSVLTEGSSYFQVRGTVRVVVSSLPSVPEARCQVDWVTPEASDKRGSQVRGSRSTKDTS